MGRLSCPTNKQLLPPLLPCFPSIVSPLSRSPCLAFFKSLRTLLEHHTHQTAEIDRNSAAGSNTTMTDTVQPYSAAAAKLVARHSKKVEKKVYNPEPDFNRIFLKDANHALRPLPHTAIEKLDGRGLLELDKFMNNVHGDRFRMTDAPHTCAACAMQFTENQYAPPCIWEIRTLSPIQVPLVLQRCA